MLKTTTLKDDDDNDDDHDDNDDDNGSDLPKKRTIEKEDPSCFAFAVAAAS